MKRILAVIACMGLLTAAFAKSASKAGDAGTSLTKASAKQTQVQPAQAVTGGCCSNPNCQKKK